MTVKCPDAPGVRLLLGAIKLCVVDAGHPTSRAWYDKLVDAVVLSAGGTAAR